MAIYPPQGQVAGKTVSVGQGLIQEFGKVGHSERNGQTDVKTHFE